MQVLLNYLCTKLPHICIHMTFVIRLLPYVRPAVEFRFSVSGKRKQARYILDPIPLPAAEKVFSHC